jgi:indole-3-glycerol phosphate synthase
MILDDIVRAKYQEIAEHRSLRPLEVLKGSALYRAERRGFAAALGAPGRAVIAEVKKASPSRGVIRPDFDPVAIARGYEAGGARAISVLTDAPFFQGSLIYLEAIRHAVSLPLLRKDFVLDAYQVHEARAFGADAVLLICAILDDAHLRDLQALAREIGLDALVEVHSREELDRAVAAGAGLVGINNRDLRTFETTLAVSERLAPLVPRDRILVGESGIFTPDDIARLARVGMKSYLVGESLMRQGDVASATAALLAGPVEA